MVSGKLQQIFDADGMEILLASQCHVRLMDNGRDMTAFTGKNNRNGYEASFGEDDIRMKDLHKFLASPSPLITRNGSVKFCTLK